MASGSMTTMGKVIWAQYDITRNRQPVAKISKQFSWIGRDQYVVDVVQGEDDCLILDVVGAASRHDLQTINALFNPSEVELKERTVSEAVVEQ